MSTSCLLAHLSFGFVETWSSGRSFDAAALDSSSRLVGSFVQQRRSTPDDYLTKVTIESSISDTSSSHFYSEVIMTESNGVLHRILRRRSHESNKLKADLNGIPHPSEFIYMGNRRSQLPTGPTLTLFTIPETNHIRYYLKHSDELGLHGGFLKWPYITLFEIKGRRLKDLKVRLKTRRRPDQFYYEDDSRLWNDGEDLNKTNGIDRLGKEWKFAFRTVKARTRCIASEGMPYNDLHILWRHNRRLRNLHNRIEKKDNLLGEADCSPAFCGNIGCAKDAKFG
ncbi:unnamed protein product [Toxocara canis]|uniref:Pep_M12B_propep domain-containing protein n=1 Tax=Toxocara canis TaxID=6265 RepID=A0A183UMD0_TOXCA|nr:unnamed protein product [Toxocara canis]